MVSQPARDKNTGVAVLVFPGAATTCSPGITRRSKWPAGSTRSGVTAAAKYRVRDARHEQGGNRRSSLMDAQRAISLARGKASDWGVDPKRIGVLGFSAGATSLPGLPRIPTSGLTKRSTRSTRSVPSDLVLIYAGVWSTWIHRDFARDPINANTPVVLIHAADDAADNSLQMYLALRKAKVPAELASLRIRRPRLRHAALTPCRPGPSVAEWLHDRDPQGGIRRP